jgi:hypothetical protein
MRNPPAFLAVLFQTIAFCQRSRDRYLKALIVTFYYKSVDVRSYTKVQTTASFF